MTAPARTSQREPEAGSERAAPAQAVLEIRDLSVTFAAASGDVKAVQHVDLTLAAGEVVGLAGESGSGKSSLALGACRLLRPPALITGGSVIYRGQRVGPEGVEILEQSARQLRRLRWREIAIVFQSAMNALNPVLRISDQLGDALDAHLDLTREQRRARLVELLDIVGIPRERLRSYPHELSGGMRQRVMIAMALAVDPEVVIMDEPTTALDTVVQREILAEIAELQRRLHFAVLFITHDLSLLLEIADRIAILYAGRLVEMGTAEEIHHRTAASLYPRPARVVPERSRTPAPAGGHPGLPARSARDPCPAVRSNHVAVLRGMTAAASTCGFSRCRGEGRNTSAPARSS